MNCEYEFKHKGTNTMKEILNRNHQCKIMREQVSPSMVVLFLGIVVASPLAIALGLYNPIYSIVAAGTLLMGIIIILRCDELVLVLIIAVRVIVDWYLGFRLVALLLGLIYLFVCYFGRSADRPWVKPRMVWLWVLFITLTIYPAIKGALDLYDADTYYPSFILSAFIMFWLGNIVARDISSVRRVFQLLTIFATLIAIHTIIEAITGKFLFLTARGAASIAQDGNYQLIQNIGGSISRAGSFLGHPNDNGAFLGFSVFLALGLFIESKRSWIKTIYLLEIMLILLALMFTYSSGSWSAVLVGTFAFLFLTGRMRYSILLAAFVAILTAIVVTIFPSQLALQLSHFTANNESSVHLGAWQTAIRVSATSPLFGVGLGGQAYLSASIPVMVPAQIGLLLEPDNTYLEWAAMAGIPVMIVFLLLLGYVFCCSLRIWQSINTTYRPLLGGGIAALVALSVNSLSVAAWTGPDGMASLGWLVAGLVTSPLLGYYLRQQSVSTMAKVAIHIKLGEI